MDHLLCPSEVRIPINFESYIHLKALVMGSPPEIEILLSEAGG
jgi:hypothetical protein